MTVPVRRPHARSSSTWTLILVTVAVVTLACAPASQDQQTAGETGRATGPKRIVAAMMTDPPIISRTYIAAGSGTIPGGDVLDQLVNAGLTILDSNGDRHPQLAEAVPTLENCLWKLFPDGRMETMWRIKPDVRWHNGELFTTADLVFTFNLGRDQELPAFRHRSYNFVEGIEATDAATVIVRWQQPYIQADAVFTHSMSQPRPRHVLERVYLEDKIALLNHAYWNTEYVGTGAFRLREWVGGSHLILSAYDKYVLGRPRIDEIEVRFLLDPSTLAANLLAGVVDLTFGRSLSLDQAMQVRDARPEVGMNIGFKNWIFIYPQPWNPNPPVVANVQFRRAMLHAIDRQALVDTLQLGMVPIAHSFLSPTEPQYKELERSIVRYDYDPGRAAQLIEDLGYRRDAGRFRDASGIPLALEFFDGLSEDLGDKTLLAVTDYWERIGVATTPVFIPPQRRADREYRSRFPAFRIIRNPNDPMGVDRYRTEPFEPTRVGSYSTPELDALIDRYMATIPLRERTSLLAQIIHQMTDQVTLLGLFYNTQPVLLSNRLRNITVLQSGQATDAWNAHEWDLR